MYENLLIIMEPTVIKRLHTSGLTPSISQQDLFQRLSTFANVKSLDGLGTLNAVGQPRKFAYATVEATPAKLSKCSFPVLSLQFTEAYYLPGLSALSGSVWKGTKLRIGEAKPDFRERCAAVYLLTLDHSKRSFEQDEDRKRETCWPWASM